MSENMSAYDKFGAFAKPSVKADFAPYINRLLQSVASEEWDDAQVDIIGLAKLIEAHKAKEVRPVLTAQEHAAFPRGRW